jgi:hypothetical protein
VLARVADDGHCADHQQPPQISITLLGDTTEPVLATRSVLLRYQPDPGGKTAPDENVFQSPISATNAVAPTGPMPGISSSRRLVSQARCRAN